MEYFCRKYVSAYADALSLSRLCRRTHAAPASLASAAPSRLMEISIARALCERVDTAAAAAAPAGRSDPLALLCAAQVTNPSVSSDTKRVVEEEIQTMLEAAYARTRVMLAKHRPEL